jgi:glycosyltransferase 2 family protein
MPSSCLAEAALSTAVADRASSPTDKPGPLTSVASVAAPRGIHQGVADGMSRFARSWGRVVGSAAVLGVLVWRLGTGPFLDGLRTIDGPTLAAATGVVMLTTLCSAWRWKTVAGGLGVDLSLPAAVTAYYRAMFLNLTLPGGVVGDVHRAVSHGRQVSDVGRAARAVAWERTAGQVVQVFLTLAVLLALPSPVHSSMPVVALAVAGAAIGLVLLVRRRPGNPRSVWARTRSAVARDIRDGLLARGVWLRVALASAVVMAGHATTFLIAARTAGATASAPRMLPLALLAMVAMVLPSIGGWGPREGATAWIFAAAGLGAQRGVATAVVYGVMVLFASSPGAAVLLVAWFRRIRASRRTERPLREQAAHA